MGKGETQGMNAVQMATGVALGGQALVELAGCLCGGALAGVLSGGRKKKRSAARKK